MTPLNQIWEEKLSLLNLTPINLVESKSLQRRTDTKFVLPENIFLNLLSELKLEYTILPSKNTYCPFYKTQYFDTNDLYFFKAHKNGRRIRFKVRIREYLNRNISYLEIKKRQSDLELQKIRKKHPNNNFILSKSDRSFIKEHTCCLKELIPSAFISCNRITLFNINVNERVTVDLNLELQSALQTIKFSNLAIIEVKQWPFKRHTSIMTILKNSHIYKSKISKYCTSIALTHPQVPYNRLRQRVNVLKGYII